MLTYTQAQLAAARKAGNFLVSASPHEFGVAFSERLDGPRGMFFSLFCEPHHNIDHINAAKRWLRSNRDVTGFRVLLPSKTEILA